MCIYIYVCVCVCVYIVTWSATERREVRSISQYPYVFELTGLKD